MAQFALIGLILVISGLAPDKGALPVHIIGLRNTCYEFGM